MSDLQEPTPNISSLSVLYPEGNFPSHIDIFGKGGFIALNDSIGGSGYNEFINERVTLERRKPGMLVYINSDNTYHKCATAGSSESTGEWDRQYFSGRYFYGAAAPTASDVVIGEKWFNTDVGSEFTYLPIDENQNTFFWVDIDHLGQGESGDIGIDLLVDGVSFAADSPTLNIAGSSPINVASEEGNGYRISLTDNFVNTSGDTMNGTLTGTDASFDSITASNGFIGTLTGNIAEFGHITADTGFIGGSLTADRAFRTSNEEFVDEEFITKEFVNLLIPAGTILPYGGDTAPDGFFLCDGSAKSSSTYSRLFDVIGTKFGGNSSNFNLPDLRARFPIGKSNSFSIGQIGGSPTITVNQMPSHNHTASSNRNGVATENPNAGWRYGDNASSEPAIQTITVGFAGGGEDYYQPYQVVNYIIKY